MFNFKKYKNNNAAQREKALVLINHGFKLLDENLQEYNEGYYVGRINMAYDLGLIDYNERDEFIKRVRRKIDLNKRITKASIVKKGNDLL